jgi:hypothetical protein
MENYKMKVAIVVIFGFLGSIGFLSLINCNGDQCCPKIVFSAVPQYLCLECPGENETAFYCTVTFTKGDKKEPCAPKEIKSSIRNLNSGKELPPLQWNPPAKGITYPPGTYQGVFTTIVDKTMLDKNGNTDFSLSVQGDEGCKAEEKVTVHVVTEGDLYTLNLNQNKPEDCTLYTTTEIFTQGVKLLEVRNKSNFDIKLKHGPQVLIKKGHASRDFAGLPARGYWEAQIAEQTSDVSDRTMCNQFLQLPQDQRKITLELVLTCKCN